MMRFNGCRRESRLAIDNGNHKDLYYIFSLSFYDVFHPGCWDFLRLESNCAKSDSFPLRDATLAIISTKIS